MNLETFFSFRFWFNLSPGQTEDRTLQVFGAIFLVSLFLFVIFLLLKRRGRPIIKTVYGKLANVFLSFGLVGFCWLFFLYEEAYLLGSRFWFLIIVLVHGVLLAKLVLYLVLQLPKEKEVNASKKAFNKYLP